MTSRDSPAFVFCVLAEAESDQRIACDLAQRVLVEEVDWLDAEQADKLCHWRGMTSDQRFMSWISVERWAKSRGIVAHGRRTGKFDERRARLALLLFNSLEPRPDLVLIVRDTDDVVDRMPSIERVRNAAWPFPVLLAMPHTKRECWVLNGFEPQTSVEKEDLDQARQKLGFDPRTQAERLTGKGRSGKKNAKMILQDLGVEPRSSREDSCWQETALDTLKERGGRTHLAAYLGEITTRLVPVVIR